MVIISHAIFPLMPHPKVSPAVDHAMKKTELGVARDLDVSDIHVEAFFAACYSALRKAPVSADIMEHVAPNFFGDPKTAAMKAMGG